MASHPLISLPPPLPESAPMIRGNVLIDDSLGCVLRFHVHSMAGACTDTEAVAGGKDGHPARGILLSRPALQEPGRIQRHPSRWE